MFIDEKLVVRLLILPFLSNPDANWIVPLGLDFVHLGGTICVGVRLNSEFMQNQQAARVDTETCVMIMAVPFVDEKLVNDMKTSAIFV